MTQAQSVGRRSGAGLSATAEGSHTGAFTPRDWLLLALMIGTFGSAFLLIDISLDHFTPGLIAFLRLALGAATLAVVPAAWTPIERRDWPRLLLFAVLWFALPFALFPLAQERIDSSLTGMLTGAVPIPQALIAAFLLRRRLGRPQVVGIVVGFGGILALTVPSSLDASATALGVGLVLLAALSWAISGNLIVPLQHRYGAPRLIFWTLLVSAVVLLPYGILDGRHSTFAWESAAALVALGIGSTGLAQIAASVFYGRAGPVRGALPAYLVPIVALILGVGLRQDTVDPLAPVGLALILVSAALLSRAEGRRARIAPAASGTAGGAPHGAPLPVPSRDATPRRATGRLLIPLLALLCASAALWFSIRKNGRLRRLGRG